MLNDFRYSKKLFISGTIKSLYLFASGKRGRFNKSSLFFSSIKSNSFKRFSQIIAFLVFKKSIVSSKTQNPKDFISFAICIAFSSLKGSRYSITIAFIPSFLALFKLLINQFLSCLDIFLLFNLNKFSATIAVGFTLSISSNPLLKIIIF